MHSLQWNNYCLLGEWPIKPQWFCRGFVALSLFFSLFFVLDSRNTAFWLQERKTPSGRDGIYQCPCSSLPFLISEVLQLSIDFREALWSMKLLLNSRSPNKLKPRICIGLRFILVHTYCPANRGEWNLKDRATSCLLHTDPQHLSLIATSVHTEGFSMHVFDSLEYVLIKKGKDLTPTLINLVLSCKWSFLHTNPRPFNSHWLVHYYWLSIFDVITMKH